MNCSASIALDLGEAWTSSIVGYCNPISLRSSCALFAIHRTTPTPSNYSRIATSLPISTTTISIHLRAPRSVTCGTCQSPVRLATVRTGSLQRERSFSINRRRMCPLEVPSTITSTATRILLATTSWITRWRTGNTCRKPWIIMPIRN